MVDRKSRVIIQGETKGFEKAAREVGGVEKALGGMEKKRRGLKDLFGSIFGKKARDELKDYRKELQGAKDDLEKLGKQAEYYRDKQGKLRSNDGRFVSGGGLAGVPDHMLTGAERAQRDKARRNRSFTMGVLQGSGVGEYFPDQELGRNFAGRMVGRVGRWGARTAGGFAGSMFSGASGFATGLAGIPIVGGMMAGQLQAGMAASQQALQYNQMRLSMLGMAGAPGAVNLQGAYGKAGLSNAAIKARAQMAGANAAAVAYSPGIGGPLSQKALAAQTSAFSGFDPTSQDAFGGFNQRLERYGDAGAQVTAKERRARQAQRRAAVRAAKAASVSSDMAKREGVAANARGRAVLDPFESVMGARKGLGFNRQEALQFGGQLLQTRGGTFRDLQGEQGLVRSAMVAQRRFGIDAGVAGAFGRGTSRGGLAGAGGRPPEKVMEEAMAQGLSMGLEGSDLQNYMRQMAQGILQWNQTGMPLNVESVGQMARAIGMAGAGGIQGQRIAQQMAQAGRGLATGGIGSASSALLFQDIFGFQGGGAEGYLEAMKRAESGDFSQADFKKFVARAGSGNKAQTAISVVRMFSQAGIQVPHGLAEKLVNGDETAAAEIQSIASGRAQVGAAAGQVKGAVRATGIGRQKALEDTRLAAGQRLLSTMQNLESMSTRGLTAISKFSTTLEMMTGGLDKAGEKAMATVDKLSKVVDELAKKIAHIP